MLRRPPRRAGWLVGVVLLCLALPPGSSKRSPKKDASGAPSTASLVKLAAKGEHEALDGQLKAGASPSTLDREGTLLTHAASAGHIDVVRVLLEHGGKDRAFIDRQVCLPLAF